MSPRNLRPLLWGVIRRLGAQGAVFGVNEVRGALRFPAKRDSVRAYLKALAAGGYLAPVTAADGGPGWQLLRDTGVDAPRVRDDGQEIVIGAGREQCWRAMRILGTFGVAELVATASTDRWAIAPGEAADYCDRLARAGILRRYKAAGDDRWLYTLSPARYTGPKPPQILRYQPAKDGLPPRRKGVYDPNTGTLYWPDGRIETGVKR